MPFVSTSFVKQVKESSSGSANKDLYLSPSSCPSGGTIRFSPLGDKSLEYFEIWGVNGEGKRRVLRFQEEPSPSEMLTIAQDQGVTLTEQDGRPSKIKRGLAFWVWNYEQEAIQLFNATQMTVLDQLASIFSDEDVAEAPGAWDIQIDRTGSGPTDTRYMVNLKPGKRKGTIATQVDAAWAEVADEYCIENLLSGNDPTKKLDGVPF